MIFLLFLILLLLLFKILQSNAISIIKILNEQHIKIIPKSN